MNLFITGATGGLGQPLATLLAAQGHHITLLSRKPGPSGHGSVVHGDLLNADTYAQALPGHDAVLHLAAVTHSPSPDKYYAANVLGTGAMVRAARLAGVRRFIFISTRAVGRACGAYGESKAMAEEAVRQSGLDWTILRPGEVYDGSGGEAVDRMIESVQRGHFVPYVADSRAQLAPVHLDDVLQAIAATLTSPASIGRAYTLAGPEVFTQGEMIRMLRTICPGPRLLLPVPALMLWAAALVFRALRLENPPFVADQIPRLLCPKESDISPAHADLGFTPRPLRQGVARCPR